MDLGTLTIIVSIAVLIMSVVAHEVAHGAMADYLGDPTARLAGRLTLNPIPHLDPFGSVILPFLTVLIGGFIIGWAKPVPYNPYNVRGGVKGEALVAFAGPLTNILLALFFGLLIRFGGVWLPVTVIPVLGTIVFINLILALFNIVPIPPLDGSKILFSFLPYHMSEVRRILEQYSLFFIVFFIFVLWRFLLPIVLWLFYIITGSFPQMFM